MLDDPEPACPPPDWACRIVQAGTARVGLEVYPPSDDTFLLLEALASDVALIRARQPLTCLEIGSGSGVVSAALRKIFDGAAYGGSPMPLMWAVDKNPAAIRCTAGLLREQQVPRADVLRGSLTGFLRPNVLDMIICNPPYVPTDEEEMQGCGISVAWAGGRRGREVIDVLLPEVARVLAPGGLFYLVCIAENEPEEIIALGGALGLRGEKAKQEQRGMEELFILRFLKD
ncbi:unnamed protein product [Effrenium voratum]|uniref:Methyltransferase small domain-containing protein n=1 Tax=Effrenium voratum TaxID=2562239 RepID=A0AA36NGZ2_9DINO|nr:unnamed protein product [Effrenium voratum]CAJ1406219.1 unnamed protein product [Effrenium voratum]CAJ1438233.1 unnamed protein product [Effrenium voratum]CAJ1450425.1 unnamed protein product [Effrenium voratum]